MTRFLTVARAKVPREAVSEYLSTLGELQASVQARGGHCWVFQRAGGMGDFLEFVETAGSDPSAIEQTSRERELVGRLRSLASYQADAAEPWEEVALSARPGASSRSRP